MSFGPAMSPVSVIESSREGTSLKPVAARLASQLFRSSNCEDVASSWQPAASDVPGAGGQGSFRWELLIPIVMILMVATIRLL